MGKRFEIDLATVQKLEQLWLLSGDDAVTDDQIACRIGLPIKSFLNAVTRNKKVIVRYEDCGKTPVYEGLKSIRTRMKGSTIPSYIQNLLRIAIKAENDKDWKTAASIREWIAEKLFPNVFGRNVGKVPKEEKGPKCIKMPLLPK